VQTTRAKNKLTLISDNPSYQPYTVSMEDVLEMWEAQYIIGKAGQQNRWDVNQLASLVNNLKEQVSVMKKRMN
jgi:hypothetical protein